LIVAHWEPPAELKRLLDALSDDIVSASDVDVAGSNLDYDTGAMSRKARGRLVRMRELIDDAIDEPGETKDRVLVPGMALNGELRQRSN
jgi:hypothetical protein